MLISSLLKSKISLDNLNFELVLHHAAVAELLFTLLQILQLEVEDCFVFVEAPFAVELEGSQIGPSAEDALVFPSEALEDALLVENVATRKLEVGVVAEADTAL
jgi:hypothetical protein